MAEYTVGTVFAQVVPSFDGVLEKISAEATKWGTAAGDAFRSSFQASIRDLTGTVDLNTAVADARVAELRTELEGLTSDHVGVDITDEEAKAKIEEIHAELVDLGATSPDIKVDVNGDRALAEIAALDAATKSLGGSSTSLARDVEGATSGVSGLGTSASEASGPISGATLALGGLATALVPIGGLALGSLAALPSIFAGLGSGIVALKLGFSGITGAIKAYTTEQKDATAASSGSSTAAITNAEMLRSAADSVRSAEEQLANARRAAADQAQTDDRSIVRAKQGAAQAITAALTKIGQDSQAEADLETRSAAAIRAAQDQLTASEANVSQAVYTETQAQKALVDARQSAADQLKSYNDQLADGALQQQQLALNLQSAQENLANVQGSPTATPLQLQQAQLAVAQAKQAIQDQSDSYAVLQRNAAAAMAAGVDGAPAVLDAQHSLDQATAGVASAQQAQADAAANLAAVQTSTAQALAAASQQIIDDTNAEAKARSDGAAAVALAESTAAENRSKSAQSIADAERTLSSALLNQQDAAKKAAEPTGAAARSTNAYAAALAGLSPAGRTFVGFVTGSLLPAFDSLKASTQGALLPGITNLLRDLLPSLTDKNGLGGFITSAASGIGALASQFGSFLKSKTGAAEMNAIFKAGSGFMVSMGDAAFTLFKAFGSVGAAAVPITKALGDGVVKLVDAFAGWVSGGGFESFLGWMKQYGPTIVSDLARIGGEFVTLLPAISGLGTAILDIVAGFGLIVSTVVGGLTYAQDEIQSTITAIRGYISDAWNFVARIFVAAPQWIVDNVLTPTIGLFEKLPGQIAAALAKGGRFVDRIFGDLLTAFGKGGTWLLDHVGTPIASFFTGLPGDIVKAFSKAGSFVDQVFAGVISAFGKGGTWLEDNIGSPIVTFFTNLPGDLARAGKGIFDWIKDAFRSIVQDIANIWNDSVGKVHFTLPSWIPGIGGKGFGFPKMEIPKFADGTGMGTYQGVALVGEHGPELAAFGQAARIIPADQTRALLSGGTHIGLNIEHAVINEPVDVQAMAQTIDFAQRSAA